MTLFPPLSGVVLNLKVIGKTEHLNLPCPLFTFPLPIPFLIVRPTQY